MSAISGIAGKPRCSGVLLHISSLPAPYGIGDLGPAAHAFARLLADAGQHCWQFLPLTPTECGIGISPYSSPSAFAGNPLFISPEALLADGLASQADLDAAESACGGLPQDDARVRYDVVERHRRALLHSAFARYRPQLEGDARFTAFCAANRDWLDDYARFVTIKESQNNAVWTAWPEPLKRRDPAALAAWDKAEAETMQRERFIQYLFHRQWQSLRRLCAQCGVALLGDIPIYVTHNSADVWAHPNFFKLDAACAPVAVTGVPPDYFSATGQRWGNPVYDWDALAADGFSWWVRRVEYGVAFADIMRIDHFRGFAGYWEIPAAEETAVNGRWAPAPGEALFALLRERLGELPVVAEDLGVITPDVEKLRDDFSLPGMRVVQFGFAGDPRENANLPFHHVPNSVVYSGTHDNAPSRAWFAAAGEDVKAALEQYVGHAVMEDTVHEVMMRLSLGSVSSLAVLPMQDVLGLGAEGCMNVPGVAGGNWEWRMDPEYARAGRLDWLHRASVAYGR